MDNITSYAENNIDLHDTGDQTAASDATVVDVHKCRC